MQAVASLPCEELAVGAATEAAEAAKRAHAVAAIVSPPQVSGEKALGKLLQLARVIRALASMLGIVAFYASACLANAALSSGRRQLP